MTWAVAIVAVLIAVSVLLRRGGNTERALEEMLTLAYGVASRGAPTADEDRAFLARHRLACPWGRDRGTVLVRAYTVPGDLSPEEAAALTGGPVAPGTTLLAPAGGPHLARLLVTLTTPGFLDRAAAATGVSVARLRRALRRRGLDLDARTLGKVPWTKLPRGQSSYHLVFVAPGDGRNEELPLDVARRLDPTANPGDRWELPPLEETAPSFFEGLVRPGGLPFADKDGRVLSVAAVEARRAM